MHKERTSSVVSTRVCRRRGRGQGGTCACLRRPLGLASPARAAGLCDGAVVTVACATARPGGVTGRQALPRKFMGRTGEDWLQAGQLQGLAIHIANHQSRAHCYSEIEHPPSEKENLLSGEFGICCPYKHIIMVIFL